LIRSRVIGSITFPSLILSSAKGTITSGPSQGTFLELYPPFLIVISIAPKSQNWCIIFRQETPPCFLPMM
jgi:hypothetical protein